MRPPEFTGGNTARCARRIDGIMWASMRPPEFTGGNLRRRRPGRVPPGRFNEAAGIHRRKHDREQGDQGSRLVASMRPPEFTGGNLFLPLVHLVI